MVHPGAIIPFQEGRTTALPEEAGYDPERLVTLDNYLQGLIRQSKLQGAGYLLSREGRIFAYRAAGMRTNREGSAMLRPDSIRPTFSVTKSLTAIAVMQLIEEGKLYLAQPASSLLNEFDTPLHKSITVLQLLTHTSGIYPDPGNASEAYPTASFDRLKGFDNWIKAALSGPLAFAPGERFGYSSAGYAILGELICKASGMPYEQYVLRRIIEPLGMLRSFFDVPAELHEEVSLAEDWEAELLAPRQGDTGKAPRASGGLFSTMEDLWKLGQMLLNGGTLDGTRILSRKSVEAMTKNVLSGVHYDLWGATSDDYPFGLGLFMKPSSIESLGTYGHDGYGWCGIRIDPVERFVAVYFLPRGSRWGREAVFGTKAIMWSGLR